MTITLNLEPRTETLLPEAAMQEGRAAESVAAALLAEALAEQARTRSGMILAIQRGLEDGAAGRVTPLADWDAKMRARHGIPADVTPLSSDELDALP